MERVACKTPGCNATILPSTAADTGGFCMPCVQRVQRAEREEYIRKNRVDIDPFKGINDPVEILKVYHTPRARDPLIRWVQHPVPVDQIYPQLSAQQVRVMVQYARALLPGEMHDQAIEIAQHVACFTAESLDDFLLDLMSKDEFYPGDLFRGAGPAIRDRVLHRLAEPGIDVMRNHLLVAAAWIGDKEVARQFAVWRERRPGWSQELFIRPEEYSRTAGWELDLNGKRQDLFWQECWTLERRTAIEDSSVRVFTPFEGNCPWCHGRLTSVVSCDLSDARLRGFGIEAERISIAACHSCANLADIFMKLTRTGDAAWMKENKPRFDIEPAEWPMGTTAPLALSNSRRLPQHASVWGISRTESQVGGLPTWIQDAEYPACPQCRKTMRFFSQVARGEIEHGTEGIYYEFLCKDCLISAVKYQQS